MINIGDKLLCKEKISTGYLEFKVDFYYSVDSIEILSSDNEDYDDNYFYYVSDESKKLFLCWGERELYKHFYTKSYVRKMKLKKLNYGY